MRPALKPALIALALSLPATAARAADPERLDKPAAQVGSSWRLRIVDGMTKLPISEAHYRIAAVAGEEVQIATDDNEVATVLDAAHYAIKRNGDIVFEPGLQRARYPMAPGDRWQAAFSYHNPQCGPTQATLNFKAAAWEDLTLPAGRFRALRVESEGVMRNGCGNNRQAHKHWYVPDLIVPVRQESTFYAQVRISRFEVHELLSLARP